MKQISANFLLEFTSDDTKGLPNARKMKHELEELLEQVVENYLFERNVPSNEVHLILADDLTIEDYE